MAVMIQVEVFRVMTPCRVTSPEDGVNVSQPWRL